jgi:hypothetical protein
MAATNNQVVVGRGREHAPCAGEHRSTRGGFAEKSAPVIL